MDFNHSINITLASLQQQSLTILASQRLPNILTTILSIIAIVTNSLLVTTIIKTKELHNKSQFVILSHAFAEVLYSVFNTLSCGRRAICAILGIPDISNQLNCIVFLSPVGVTAMAALLAILMLGIDRLLVVGAPIRYKQLNPTKYILGLNLLCWGIPLGRMPLQFLGVNKIDTVPVCMYALAVPIGYRSADSLAAQIVVCVTAFVYALATTLVAYQYWGYKWETEAQRTSWARQIRMGAFKMMITVGCIYIGCWGLGQAASSILTWYTSAATVATFGPYIALLLAVNTASHFFVYVTMSGTFRKAARKALFREGSANAVSFVP